MNPNKLRRHYKSNHDLDEGDLAAALDESARAAVALGLDEQVLVEQMLCSLRSVVRDHEGDTPKKMYDSSAGP